MKIIKDLKNTIIVITYAIVLIVLAINPKIITNIFNQGVVIFKPVILALVISFIINIPMKFIEELLLTKFRKIKIINKSSRGIALILTLLLVALFITMFISYIIPQLLESMSILVSSIPSYIESAQEYIQDILNKTDSLKMVNIDVPSTLQKVLTLVSNIINYLISNIFNMTVGVTSFIIDLVLGLIISIYILLNKEILSLQGKKLIYAFTNQDKGDAILDVLNLANFKFSKFILGQFIDCAVLSGLCFIGMSLFKMPYALLISAIIPISNLVPIFGTFVGICISAFIVFMAKPSVVIFFLVLVVTIQQIEGNFIYPLIVGNYLGISSLWILLAIVVGGNLFGIVGIIVGIPLASVLYELISRFVNKKIKDKDITI